MRSLKTFVLPVFLGLAVLALVGLLGSALLLFREASAVHPVLGWLVAALIAAGLALLIVIPVIQLFRFPGALVRPRKSEGRAWERFVRRYGRRLANNSLLRTEYDGFSDLARAQGKDAGCSLERVEAEVDRAIRFLDAKAEEVITRYAATVFTTTAVSQSGRLDTAIVFSAQLRMIKEVAQVYYQRPQPRELWSLYANVGAAGFLAGEIQDSELLAVLGAPVTAGITNFIPVVGSGPLVSLLVNSLLDGSANAFLTLRIGVLARRYCGLRPDNDRRVLARSAALESAGLLGAVVSRGAGRVAAMTRKLVLGSAAKGTTRAARGVADFGHSIFAKIFGLAGQAGAAAADTATEGAKVLQESLRFWETVAESGEKSEEREGAGLPG
jgi:hypothetical protein